jgi:ribose 5-phosphate isomerase B
MRIAVGSDHRGFRLRTIILELLEALGEAVLDEGPHLEQEEVDYPDVAARVAGKVSRGEVDRGILICSNGVGMCIAANKFPGVRAAACYDDLTAEMSRRHNDLNVLCLSSDIHGERVVDRMLQTWLQTDFEGGRHARRVEKIRGIEQTPRHARKERRDSATHRSVCVDH